MDRNDLMRVFERLDDVLTPPQAICVIKASAILGYGHSLRQTEGTEVASQDVV